MHMMNYGLICTYSVYFLSENHISIHIFGILNIGIILFVNDDFNT